MGKESIGMAMSKMGGKRSGNLPRLSKRACSSKSNNLHIEELISFRLKMGLTQEEMARIFDCTQAQLSRWESGKEIPRKTRVEQLIRIIGFYKGHTCVSNGDSLE